MSHYVCHASICVTYIDIRRHTSKLSCLPCINMWDVTCNIGQVGLNKLITNK